jgi:hypothetical protein
MTPIITNLVPLACKASTAPTIGINLTNRIADEDDTIIMKPMWSSKPERIVNNFKYKQATEHKETEVSQTKSQPRLSGKWYNSTSKNEQDYISIHTTWTVRRPKPEHNDSRLLFTDLTFTYCTRQDSGAHRARSYRMTRWKWLRREMADA